MVPRPSVRNEPSLTFLRPEADTLVLQLAGSWRLGHGTAGLADLERQMSSRPPRRLAFDTQDLAAWDTGLLTFLARVGALCRQHGVTADRSGLPEGVRRLLALAEAVPERSDARASASPSPWLARVGLRSLALRDGSLATLSFIGEATGAVLRMLTLRARYRRSDLLLHLQQAGVEALPIVSLISFLVGLILAFVGAVQLRQFGASIYVADLVGIAMVREMGAMMTGIVMAGRTGASFAAQLGSMKVTQEVDALRTTGIHPFEFLVLPRMVALFLMMPLLCLYSDLLGILGGAVVGIGMLDLSPKVYFQQTEAALSLTDLAGGIFKASVYGVLIALSGCLRGLQCGNSSSAVGDATTSAVVTSIVGIISACGLFAVLFYVLGI